jgi:outer membrane protein OmpA-like peptidoglycan-associated protein
MEALKQFLLNGTKSEKLIPDAEARIVDCEYAIEAIKSPVAFNPVSLGDSVNSDFNDYSPSITADGNVLMFTREIETGGNQFFRGRRQEDFYVSYRLKDGSWTKARDAGPPLNTPGNEGAQTIGAGGQYMFFTACDRPDGLGRCDIYFSVNDGRRWTEPYNIGPPVNSPYWESQPSISADGKTLFFISNRPGGSGRLDIWISEVGPDGRWQEPYNAGDVINTSGDEVTPFIHFDGKTLYFSSDGRPNMGGFDIYMARKMDDGKWSAPENIGYPINTYADEMGLVIESNGFTAYFSSTFNMSGLKDLYQFDLPPEVRPEKVSYLRGRVSDAETRRSLKAKYEVTNLSTGEIMYGASTTADGQFLVCLPSGYNYGLNVSAEGYLFYSENFPFDGDYSEYRPLVKDIMLHLLKPGEKLVLYNILFNINSAELLPGSKTELDKLHQILVGNPGLRVEIGGHTDDTGSDELNQKLSESRASAVVRYLTGKGIDPDRLTYRGFGKTMPVQDNSTVEGRRLNRRTEVIITEIIK